jgi:hypothetical protein
MALERVRVLGLEQDKEPAATPGPPERRWRRVPAPSGAVFGEKRAKCLSLGRRSSPGDRGPRTALCRDSTFRRRAREGRPGAYGFENLNPRRPSPLILRFTIKELLDALQGVSLP